MNNTPNSLRKHIGIFGDTNSGKSELFNKIINQEMAIVSDKEGTTTDPVKKAMELIGFGPVLFIDTPGTSDNTALSDLRNKKTVDLLNQVDYALIVCDIKNYNEKAYNLIKSALDSNNTPYTIVISKKDTLSDKEIKEAREKFKDALFVSSYDENSIDMLKKHIAIKLGNSEEAGLLDGLVSEGDNVILVIPIDSEAPKGRLILPQVQTIRECLTKKAFCHIANEENLYELLNIIKNVSLVITDSSIFKTVNEIINKDIRLTSFSMLLARQKGDFKALYDGAKHIEKLKDEDYILISEVCTHTTSHEDIAKVKIPKLISDYTKKKLNFEFSSGFSFPDDLSKYSLVIHCGGCMVTKKVMESRIKKVREKIIPITNFGVILSYLTGAYDRQEFLKNSSSSNSVSINERL